MLFCVNVLLNSADSVVVVLKLMFETVKTENIQFVIHAPKFIRFFLLFYY